MLVIIRGAGDIAPASPLRLHRSRLSPDPDRPAPAYLHPANGLLFRGSLARPLHSGRYGSCSGSYPAGSAGSYGAGPGRRADRSGKRLHPAAAPQRGGGRDSGKTQSGNFHGRCPGGDRRRPRLHRPAWTARRCGDHAGTHTGPCSLYRQPPAQYRRSRRHWRPERPAYPSRPGGRRFSPGNGNWAAWFTPGILPLQ